MNFLTDTDQDRRTVDIDSTIDKIEQAYHANGLEEDIEDIEEVRDLFNEGDYALMAKTIREDITPYMDNTSITGQYTRLLEKASNLISIDETLMMAEEEIRTYDTRTKTEDDPLQERFTRAKEFLKENDYNNLGDETRSIYREIKSVVSTQTGFYLQNINQTWLRQEREYNRRS
ncbi:MAG: hypothetical protein ACOCZV_00335 [Nanoarchaeota archaeon]